MLKLLVSLIILLLVLKDIFYNTTKANIWGFSSLELVKSTGSVCSGSHVQVYCWYFVLAKKNCTWLLGQCALPWLSKKTLTEERQRKFCANFVNLQDTLLIWPELKLLKPQISFSWTGMHFCVKLIFQYYKYFKNTSDLFWKTNCHKA